MDSAININIIDVCASRNQSDIKNIWIKLQPYLVGIKRVFFSPDGILHTLPIESYEVKYDVDFYRLSSTRELLINHNIQYNGAIIYGGLCYDTSAEQLEADAKKYKETNQVIEIGDTNYRGVITENVIPYLEGTKKEAEGIAKICQSKNENVQMFSKNEGTEASFKNHSGKRMRFMHIGTHGFYNKDEKETGHLKQINIIENITMSPVVVEDNSLRRCGLLLSGAENGINKKVSSYNDGILTAHDVSMLDLRGLDLISLSACCTGLGDITSDGIFGLQRGFKKAGVHSILMSLWEVHDEATCLLMTEFYTNWIEKGKSKHDALELAKQTVRSHKEKGWDDPKFWAAFILLDALD